MTISVVIPAYNEEMYLGTCLQSIVDHKNSEVIEVIVVDNASTDETATIAKNFPGVRVVHEPTKGTGPARQRSLSEARGTLLAFIDADTNIGPGWCETVTEIFAQDPAIVGASGPYDYFDLPSWQRALIWFYWRFLVIPFSFITGPVVIGGNFIAKKSALQAIGGFDTGISFYGDDTNIARRLKSVGTMRFDLRLLVRSSGRRLAEEGILRTGFRYVINYLSQSLLRRSVTRHYTDVR
ncbi:MAG: glycosyltransferase [Candidatus Peribacteraceae bacterium]|nr:glycosyltransferase [Candidatus Peribacteraceae bacterium]